MKNLLNTIKTEPALITGVVQTALALAVGLGLDLTAARTGAVLAFTTAVLALVTAISARPFAPAALTGLVTALVTLLVAFGVKHVSTGEIASINAAITAVMALVLRGHITPVATLKAEVKAEPVPVSQ